MECGQRQKSEEDLISILQNLFSTNSPRLEGQLAVPPTMANVLQLGPTRNPSLIVVTISMKNYCRLKWTGGQANPVVMVLIIVLLLLHHLVIIMYVKNVKRKMQIDTQLLLCEEEIPR